MLYNLVLHHFTTPQVEELLKATRAMGAAILINDLQRSRLAYQLFRIASRLAGFSSISRYDGSYLSANLLAKKTGKRC
ncbi:MAG: hypothetical protein U5L96_04540 [Owenweeksia sp.]|nr:hypothetical protein [Owenweeksia sp.]